MEFPHTRASQFSIRQSKTLLFFTFSPFFFLSGFLAFFPPCILGSVELTFAFLSHLFFAFDRLRFTRFLCLLPTPRADELIIRIRPFRDVLPFQEFLFVL